VDALPGRDRRPDPGGADGGRPGRPGRAPVLPALYRKIFKPREARLVRIVRKHSKAKIYFHSCGAIREYIPDLIEIGVDALNPCRCTPAAWTAPR